MKVFFNGYRDRMAYDYFHTLVPWSVRSSLWVRGLDLRAHLSFLVMKWSRKTYSGCKRAPLSSPKACLGTLVICIEQAMLTQKSAQWLALTYVYSPPMSMLSSNHPTSPSVLETSSMRPRQRS